MVLSQTTSLLITQDYPPRPGGIARYYAELCRRFPAGAVDVSTVAAGKYEHEPHMEAPGDRHVFTERMPFELGRANRFVHVMQWARRAGMRVSVRDIDVIQAGNIRPAGYIAAWLRAAHGTPYVVYLHGRDLLKERRKAASSRRSWWTGRWILGNASICIANSSATAELARDHLDTLELDPTGRVRVVHPGTDPARFQIDHSGAGTWRKRLEVGDRPLLLSVARLVPRKGVDTTLRALARMPLHGPTPIYAIAGAGPDRRRLEQLTGELDLTDRVRFLGTVAEAQLPGLYSAADVFVLPTREIPEDDEVEGFGIVYCEAQAAGLPIIAAKSGGVADAVRDGEVGRLIPPDDADALAEAIRAMLEEPLLRERMGRAGRRAVEEYFNWRRAANEAWEIIEEVGAPCRRSPDPGAGPGGGTSRDRRSPAAGPDVRSPAMNLPNARSGDPAVVHLDGGRRWGGGQNQIRLLMRGLSDRGIRQLCVCPRGSPLEDRLLREGLPVRSIRWWGGVDVRAAFGVARIISGFDIVHCHDAHALQLAVLPAKLRRQALVASRRVIFTARAFKWNRPDRVIAISNAVRSALLRDGVSGDRIVVIPSGLDAAEVRSLASLEPSLRDRFGIQPDHMLVAMIGRLEAGKGQRIIPAAAAALPSSVHWAVIGDGPDRGRLARHAAAAGAGSRVHLAGALPDARAALGQLDAFVFTSARDGLGTSILDAMAAGVPVVAANAEGAAEILAPVHQATGATLFPPGDAAALANRIRTLRDDSALRSAMLSAQEERLRDFSITAATEQTLALYHQLGADAARAGRAGGAAPSDAPSDMRIRGHGSRARDARFAGGG